jgi:RNA polymerase sigma-70 factor (ECF subfamily)
MKISQEVIDSLVEKAQGGDIDAFSMLYDELLNPIFRFCFFKVSNKETAEDITSDVFLTVWNKLSSYEKTEDIQFSSWVFRIAHNKVMDYFRRNRDTLELKEELEIESTSFDEVSKKVENDFLREELLNALSNIPKSQAESLALKYFSELENNEIAQIMDKSETAVRILQSRGLKTIREYLEVKHQFEEEELKNQKIREKEQEKNEEKKKKKENKEARENKEKKKKSKKSQKKRKKSKRK